MTARLPSALVIVLAAAAFAAGCGSSSLSDPALRSRATRICRTAARHANRIDMPTSPAGAMKFVSQGITALTPALVALKRLRAAGDTAAEYRNALAAFEAEVSSLRFTLKGLRAGNDPVVAVKTLQQQLAPSEARARASWDALGIPACGALTT